MNESKLLEMLTYKRPAWADTENQFIAEFIEPLPGIYFDGYGNAISVVGQSETLFSCHTDTVHMKGGRQPVYKDSVSNIVYTDGSDVLGADDAIGCFIMGEMILAGVPGTYVFHRAEEIGVGS